VKSTLKVDAKVTLELTVEEFDAVYHALNTASANNTELFLLRGKLEAHALLASRTGIKPADIIAPKVST
jgi:hypothetical protein